MITFAEYLPIVLDMREREGVRGIATERNRAGVHLASAPFAPLPLGEIRGPHIRAWLGEMQQKTARDHRGDRLISTQTVARSLALASAVFGRAVESELVPTNPCHGVRLRKRAEELTAAEPWTYLTLGEQRALAESERIWPIHRAAIAFAIGTGLRQGEQMHLPIDEVHVDGSTPHVNVRFGSKNKPPKSGKSRIVPLFGSGLVAAREALAWSTRRYNPERVLFPGMSGRRRSTGKPLGSVYDEFGEWEDGWKQAKRYANILRRVRWHDLRHTFASCLVSGAWGHRWPLPEIRSVMGHSSVTITERYAHLGDDAIHAAARATGYIPPAPDTLLEIDVPPECVPGSPVDTAWTIARHAMQPNSHVGPGKETEK